MRSSSDARLIERVRTSVLESQILLKLHAVILDRFELPVVCDAELFLGGSIEVVVVHRYFLMSRTEGSEWFAAGTAHRPEST